MQDGLYHRDIFLPIRLGFAAFVKYSAHARQAAQDDRYGALTLPAVISTQEADVIEVEVANGKPHKAVLRMRHDDERDLCVVVLLDTCVVKTVWCNLRTDTHGTLDRTKYMAA